MIIFYEAYPMFIFSKCARIVFLPYILTYCNEIKNLFKRYSYNLPIKGYEPKTSMCIRPLIEKWTENRFRRNAESMSLFRRFFMSLS